MRANRQINATLLLLIAVTGCKSRPWSTNSQGSDLLAAMNGPSNTDNALAELEVVDCSQLAEGLCGNGDGLAFVNPSQKDLYVAYNKKGIDFKLNPYDFGNTNGNPDVVYALTGKSAEMAASDQSAQLDQIAGAWNSFALTAGSLHKTPSVATAVEILMRSVLGSEIIQNPASFDPGRFAPALEQLSTIFDQVDAGTLNEQSASEQIAAIARSGGFGHPTFDRLANGVRANAGGNGGLNLDGGIGQRFMRNFAELRALSNWYDKNLVASSKERKADLIIALKNLIPQVKKLEEILLRHKITEEAKLAIMDALRVIAGQDGYINHGDLPRLLPVVPDLVGQVADIKIEEGLADGIAELRATKPFIYKRWARSPNGLIGRIVNKEINRNLNKAYAMKFQAINQASTQVQRVFNDAMGKFGVMRHFLLTDAAKDYFDPGNPLELAQIDRVVRAVTGKPVLTIAAEAAAGGNAGLGQVETVARDLEGPMINLFQKVELPDGIFVDEALELAEKQMSQSGGLALPAKLQFVLANNGKIRIGRRREPCSCEYMTNINKCVFKFFPHAQPQAATDKRYYQELSGKSASINGAAACDDYNQCAVQFGRRDFQFHMPYACGGYFWTRPGDVLYTTK